MIQTLADRTVFITGANGGLGRQFVQQALTRGARRVYAGARSPEHWNDDRVVGVAIDLTDPESVAAAAVVAGDADVLVNNAGIAPADDRSVVEGDEAVLRRVFETNLYGTLRVMKAFAPVLERNGGGAVLTVLSLSSWLPLPTAYAISKAALLSATNAVRLELRSRGTSVTGLLVGMVDTPMSARWDVPKSTAASVVEQAYDGLVSGAFEVYADAETRQVKALLGASAEDFVATLDTALGEFVP